MPNLGPLQKMRALKRLFLLIFALLLTLPAVVFAEDAPNKADAALPCEYTVPEEVESYVSHLFDGDPFTTVSLYPDEHIEMKVPSGEKTLIVGFYEANKVYSLMVFDADGRRLSSMRKTTSIGYMSVPLDASASTVKIYSESRFLVLSDFFAAADDGALPFRDTNDRADILIVLNTPGDELTKLGGLLPALCGEHGFSARVMYLNGADGYHSHQCIQVLERMGIQKAPYFGTGDNATVKGDKAALRALGLSDNQLKKLLTNEIRTCRPQILITLNTDKKEGSFMDAFIARAVLEAVGLAEDPSRYAGTGAHTVSKVYTLSETGETVFSGAQPLYAFDGVTADAFADELYGLYREERMFRRDMPETVRFTLQRSTVGADEKKDDLLEHLVLDSFENYQCPTPTPEPTPEPTATPDPTVAPTPVPAKAEPTEKPTEEKTPEPKTESASGAKLWWLPGAIGAALAAAILIFAKKRLWFLLPLCIGIALSILLLTGVFTPANKPAVTAEAETTPALTEAPTPAPTEEPTPAPTEAPTPEPTPDPSNAYFLSEPGEVFELDWDNGHWWYKSDVLAVDVHEVHSTQQEGKPHVYYVADIRMREYSSYRSGVRAPLMPYVYARTEKAVLAITGDNLIDAEKELKGCLIRKGKFYFNAGKSETLVIKDDMTLSVLPVFGASERILLDHGVRDTYGFGPTLVENGQIAEVTKKHRVDHPNPRCGIGMVEPGHWVAIATEGRQMDFSYSITLDFFAQMFIDYGCTVAFNMDGGSSVGIVFMGEALNRHYMPGTVDIQRKWPDALLFGYSEQIPSPNTPTIHDGYRHGY